MTTLARRLPALLLVLCLAVLTACSGTGDDGAPAEAGPAPTDAPTGTADAAERSASADAEGQTATAQAPDPGEDEAPGASLPDGPVTALLIGTDARDGAPDGRSDVIVLVQLSEDREQLTLVSVARDSYVDIPGHGQDKVNAAFARGGSPLLRQTVSELMGGLEIDLVARTDFETFTALTGWMDGFWVENQHASTVSVGSTGREVELEEGRILLDGTAALAYVREREDLPLGDLDRAERHRAALVGMMERLVEIREEEPAKLLELLPMLSQNVEVEGDLGIGHLLTMVDVGAQLGPDDVTSLMVPVSHFASTDAGASVNVLDEARTRELAAGLREGDVSDYVERYGTSYAPTDG